MAHPDLNALLNALLPFVGQMLAAHGEFYPFGSNMKPSGEIIAVGARDGDEHPPSQNLIDLMTQAFRQQAATGQLRAAGICDDVRTIPPGKAEKTDAVCMALEHQSGESITVYLPYRRAASGSVEYGQMFAARKAPQFFCKD
jgi:hypothetical protein